MVQDAVDTLRGTGMSRLTPTGRPSSGTGMSRLTPTGRPSSCVTITPATAATAATPMMATTATTGTRHGTGTFIEQPAPQPHSSPGNINTISRGGAAAEPMLIDQVIMPEHSHHRTSVLQPVYKRLPPEDIIRLKAGDECR